MILIFLFYPNTSRDWILGCGIGPRGHEYLMSLRRLNKNALEHENVRLPFVINPGARVCNKILQSLFTCVESH